MLEDLKDQIVRYGRRIAEKGLTTGTSGNLSVYDPESGLVAISPSGIDYFETQQEDIDLIDLQGKLVEGKRKPSSEYHLHIQLYRKRPDLRAVVHTHAPYCSVFAALHQPVHAVHYVIADANTDCIPCVDYYPFGTRALADAAVEVMGEANAVILANHGAIACGRSLKGAFSLTEEMEYLAMTQYRALCIGQPVYLTKEQVGSAIQAFQSYGQDKKATEDENR